MKNTYSEAVIARLEDELTKARNQLEMRCCQFWNLIERARE